VLQSPREIETRIDEVLARQAALDDPLLPE
jgi:hypothetical protein